MIQLTKQEKSVTNYSVRILAVGVLFFQLLSCQSHTSSKFKDTLTFYVSFDNGTTADFALGDANIYTANGSYVNMKRELDSIRVGMNNPNHQIVEGRGKFGDAFEFSRKRNNQVIFYKSKDNVHYNPKNWSGSISFWLSVDPSVDLNGFTDPIQLTDVNFNDASIWVDFTDENPPNFRLGVIGDRNDWTQDTLNSSFMVEFEKRLVDVDNPPFSRTTWTHILVTYDQLGTANSISSLYLNGEKQGVVSGIDDLFTWDIEESNIFLGLGYTGLIDELSIFNKPFTDKEAMELYQLRGGIKSIL